MDSNRILPTIIKFNSNFESEYFNYVKGNEAFIQFLKSFDVLIPQGQKERTTLLQAFNLFALNLKAESVANDSDLQSSEPHSRIDEYLLRDVCTIDCSQYSLTGKNFSMLFHSKIYCDLNLRAGRNDMKIRSFQFRNIEIILLFRFLMSLMKMPVFHYFSSVLTLPSMSSLFKVFHHLLGFNFNATFPEMSLAMMCDINLLPSMRNNVDTILSFDLIGLLHKFHDDLHSMPSFVKQCMFNGRFADNVQFTTIRLTEAFRDNSNVSPRIQVHGLIFFPLTSIKNCESIRQQLNTTKSLGDETLRELISNITALPLELQVQIYNSFEPFSNLRSVCSTFECRKEIHSSRCRRGRSFINNRKTLLFPVKRMIGHDDHGNEYLIWYVLISSGYVYSRSTFVGPSLGGQLFELLTDVDDTLLLDPCHSQPSCGFLFSGKGALAYYNLSTNSPISVHIHDKTHNVEWLPDFKSSNGQRVLARCEHRHSFVPRIVNQQDHLLVFD